MNKKQTIRINEEQLQKIIEEATIAILNEEQNEGMLKNMFQGLRQGRQDYKAAQQPYKDATKQAKQYSKEQNKLAQKYGKYIKKDYQTISEILSHYDDYPQIAKAARTILGALRNLNTQMQNNATNASDAYQTARSNQEINKQQLDNNMTQNFRNTFSGNSQNAAYQQAM